MCPPSSPPSLHPQILPHMPILTFSWLPQSVSNRQSMDTPSDTDNIVCTWLRFLHVGEYSEKFLDNGYDDLETVKQIQEEDLRAIGVDNHEDEEIILLSVKILREQGAAWVYFLCEDHDSMSSFSATSQKMSVSDDEPSSNTSSFRSDIAMMRRPTAQHQLGQNIIENIDNIEPFNVCDNIYCDITDDNIECSSQQTQDNSSWSDFWRNIFNQNKKKKTANIKRGKSLRQNIFPLYHKA